MNIVVGGIHRLRGTMLARLLAAAAAVLVWSHIGIAACQDEADPVEGQATIAGGAV